MKLIQPAKVKPPTMTEEQKDKFKLRVIKELVKNNITEASATDYVNTYFPILIKEWEVKHKKYPSPKHFAQVLVGFSSWSARMYDATAWQMEQ